MATNRADTLDPALLRPGRLDRKIEFPLPDRRQKRLVFQVPPPLQKSFFFASRAVVPAAASRCRFLSMCGVAAHCIACAIGILCGASSGTKISRNWRGNWGCTEGRRLEDAFVSGHACAFSGLKYVDSEHGLFKDVV